MSPQRINVPSTPLAIRTIPEGLCPPAQGCEPASYPGFTCKLSLNPNGVVATFGHPWAQPRWSWLTQGDDPRVARFSQPWALLRNPFGIREITHSRCG